MATPALYSDPNIQVPYTRAELLAYAGRVYKDLQHYTTFVPENIDTQYTRMEFQRAILGLRDLAFSYSVENFTADSVLTAAQSGEVLTNDGAAGAVVLTLPAAVVGRRFKMINAAAQVFKFLAAGADTIKQLSFSGTHLFSSEQWAYVELICPKTGVWVEAASNTGWTIG